jgi:hypothetical protein
MTTTVTVTSVSPLANQEYLVEGTASVDITSGAGNFTVSQLATIDNVLMCRNNSDSATTPHYTDYKIDSSTKNQVDLTDFTITVSSSTWALTSGSSLTVNFAVIGH